MLYGEHVSFRRDGRTVEDPLQADQVLIWIPGSKADWVGQGCERTHFKSGSDLCVVSALAVWMVLTTNMPPEAPLFALPEGVTVGCTMNDNQVGHVRLLQKADLARVLKATAVQCGQRPELFAGHSCRIGGATALLQANVDPSVIQIIGRWASDVWKLYTRVNYNLFKPLSGMMTNADVAANQNPPGHFNRGG